MHVTINVTYMYDAKTFDLKTGCFKTTCRACAVHEPCTAQLICAKKIMTLTKELNFCVGSHHTLSAPVIFLALFICIRESSVCHVVSVRKNAGNENECLCGCHYCSWLLSFGE